MSAPDWRDILLKAASQVEEEGLWCQGELFQDHGEMWRELWLEVGRSAATKAELMEYRIARRVPRCALGAIEVAAFQLFGPDSLGFDGGTFKSQGERQEGRAVQELHAEVGEVVPIPVWNDQPERTAQEVADAMRRAATRGN